MKSLYFATSNQWKFERAKSYFAKHEISLKQANLDLPESRDEDGTKIAKEKAHFAFKKLKKPVFVLDGSFHIKALNDFPKTYVKLIDKYIGAKGILKLLKGEKDRRWEILNILYYKDKKEEKCFVHAQKGKIVKKLNHNKKGSIRDFDRVLVPESYKKTFAQMTKKEWKEYDNKIWFPGVYDNFINWLK